MTPHPLGLTLAGLAAMSGPEQTAALQEDAGHTARVLHEAACHGMVEAQTTLGQMLLDGRGTPPDAAAARRWFTLAAQAGHAPAANMLGRCLERGWGGSVDVEHAVRWYRRAAEASLDWGQYNLGNMLLRGRGVARDVSGSFEWFLAAARQGHAKSMNLVARFLEEGWAGPIDLGQARAWYHRAAAGGDFRAQYNLGTLLAQQGQVEEAADWFERSGAHGSADFRRVAAEQLLARPEPLLRLAGLHMAKRCCDGGEAEDHYRYGMALSAGPHPQLALAAAWLQRAHRAGHEPAGAALALLPLQRSRHGIWQGLRRALARIGPATQGTKPGHHAHTRKAVF